MKLLGCGEVLVLIRRRGMRVLLLAALTAAAVAVGHAQSSSASVNGIVRDATGAVVPDVTVVLRNMRTNLERRAVTNEVGVYVLLNILPGEYTLEAFKDGFKTSRALGFQLSVNQTATHDFTLEVGEVEQTINVEGSLAEVQASTAELGSVVAHRQVQDLPLNGRNFTQLLTLTPGVSPVNVSQSSGGFGASLTTGAQFTFPSINGQTNRSNFFMLDGINNQGSFTSTYAVPPIVDSIQEFKVQSHNDEAEFGGVLGGIINVVSKSGTNEFHGALWELLRNDALDARNTFFQNKTAFRQNQYGVTVGGPVVIPKVYDGRNRTFFFAGWQGFRYRRPANTFFRVPTDANLRGDLSDIPQAIFNPFSTMENPDAAGTFVRDAFPNNQIPSSLLDQGMLRYAQETLPDPVATGNATFNALDSTPYQQNQEEYTVRVDQSLGTKGFLWFRYSGLLQDTTGSGGRQALQNTTEGRARNWGLSWTHTFSPTALMQMQIGRTHYRYDTTTRFRNLTPSFAQEIGFISDFAGFVSGEGATLIPGLSVAGFFSGGENDDLQPDFTDIYQYKASASKIIGSHTLKWGGEINSNHFEAIYHRLGVGFANAQTNDPGNPGPTGSALASYLLGVPNNASRQDLRSGLRWGGVLSFYVHDQWKVTPRLTLNLGLRYDRTFIPPFGLKGSEGQIGGIETGSYDLQRGVYIVQKLPPSCAERGTAPCIPGGQLPAGVEVSPNEKIYRDTTKNFQPRVGFAYRLTDNTALRGSFGVFFDNWAAITQSAQNYPGSWPDVGSQLAQNLNTPVPSRPTPGTPVGNPLPDAFFPAPTPFNSVLWYMDPNHENAYSLQWNLGIQRQLNPSTVVTANYVGSGSRRLNIGGIYNVALTPGPGDPAERRPFPHIAPTFYDRSWGRGNYHAFQFSLDKKFTGGLAYLLSYTWSKSIDVACSGWYGIEGCSVQDPYSFNNDRGPSGFDVTHIATMSWVYELPVGPGKQFQTGNRVVDYIIGNWQINGIATFRSGIPYNATVSGDIANTGNSDYERLNVVGDYKLSNPTPQQWFSTAAFSSPAPFTFGNLGRHRLRGDGAENFDVSIFRQFSIGEGKRLEFRAEFFNSFNTPTYGPPASNLSDPNFGRVTSTENLARQVQLGLKIIF